MGGDQAISGGLIRIRKQDIFEVHFGRGELIECLPYAIRKMENREVIMVHRFNVGYSLSHAKATVNADRVSYWLKVKRNMVQVEDVEADEDGNEVEVWAEADYDTANKFQFHQTNHRQDMDPGEWRCPKCSVQIWSRDDDGTPIEWRI